MGLDGIALFALALFVAAATPGPAVAAIVARVTARGPAGIIAFAIGLALGDVAWLGIAVLGLAALALAFDGVLTVIRLAGALYLLVIAWQLWTAEPDLSGDALVPPTEHPLRLALAGFALSLGNPKVIVFYLALLPNLVDLRAVTSATFAGLAILALVILGTVLAGYILLATRARRLFRSPAALRRMRRGGSIALAGAAVAIAIR